MEPSDEPSSQTTSSSGGLSWAAMLSSCALRNRSPLKEHIATEMLRPNVSPSKRIPSTPVWKVMPHAAIRPRLNPREPEPLSPVFLVLARARQYNQYDPTRGS